MVMLFISNTGNSLREFVARIIGKGFRDMMDRGFGILIKHNINVAARLAIPTWITSAMVQGIYSEDKNSSISAILSLVILPTLLNVLVLLFKKGQFLSNEKVYRHTLQTCVPVFILVTIKLLRILNMDAFENVVYSLNVVSVLFTKVPLRMFELFATKKAVAKVAHFGDISERDVAMIKVEEETKLSMIPEYPLEESHLDVQKVIEMDSMEETNNTEMDLEDLPVIDEETQSSTLKVMPSIKAATNFRKSVVSRTRVASVVESLKVVVVKDVLGGDTHRIIHCDDAFRDYMCTVVAGVFALLYHSEFYGINYDLWTVALHFASMMGISFVLECAIVVIERMNGCNPYYFHLLELYIQFGIVLVAFGIGGETIMGAEHVYST
ncbi:UNVERIFIED_CONTAM: hypothetical protein HDU68_011025 [Siphonaria sp. JEL0065]|nr:hypothetical protein HDU68_011025 [Siphonaria sp. JEL0065]